MLAAHGAVEAAHRQRQPPPVDHAFDQRCSLGGRAAPDQLCEWLRIGPAGV
jgi:hypothetical protein